MPKAQADLQGPAGILQPLPIPRQVWSVISMYFIDGLPVTKRKTILLVVVDCLSKYSHFISTFHPYTETTVSQVFFVHIFKLHGMPRSIARDRNLTFTSAFRCELFKMQGTHFNFSSAYHPQTDGQTEVVIALSKCISVALRVHGRKSGLDGLPGQSIATIPSYILRPKLLPLK